MVALCARVQTSLHTSPMLRISCPFPTSPFGPHPYPNIPLNTHLYTGCARYSDPFRKNGLFPPNIIDVSENFHSLFFHIILPSKSTSFEVLLGLKAKEKVMATITGGLSPGRTVTEIKSYQELLKTVLRCPTNSLCCKSMSMLHVHVHAHAACPCPCCMSTMLHVHVHATCPCKCCM